jgi:GrpB-like predicted nucleotidyltransferase (UPF0157 family)/GNAT superfamily N-acetyltransferase
MGDEILIGGIEVRSIVLADYNDSWPLKFREHATAIKKAMGSGAVAVEHVGSTAVPNIAAKPIIDVLLVVEDSGNESEYLPLMTGIGYELRVREPEWHEHRMFRTEARDVHVHVFSQGCVEISRMLTFRNRLRRSKEDRLRYELTKRRLAAKGMRDMNAYAEAKSEIVKSILSGELQISNAAETDADSIMACARAAYSKYVRRIGREPAPMNADFRKQIAKGIVYVAQIASEFAGFIVFYPSDNERIHIESVAVLPELMGQGIGRVLIRHAEMTAAARGFNVIELYTNEAMTENLAMYARLGYVETGRGQQDGFSRVYFRKQL